MSRLVEVPNCFGIKNELERFLGVIQKDTNICDQNNKTFSEIDDLYLSEIDDRTGLFIQERSGIPSPRRSLS